MTQYYQDPALWGLIAVVSVGATAIIRSRKSIAAYRKREIGLKSGNASLEENYAEAVEEAKREAEANTRSALKASMRTMQGHASAQQRLITETQAKYGDHAILQDLLEIDHLNSQFARRAQSIAVLCGGWLGRQRSAASLYDVVRSAKGRIRHFTRVEIRTQSDLAVVSRAVEPVAAALAELLDNATSYSAPETNIEINIQRVANGVCIIVDDAGVGMNEEEKIKAKSLLETTEVEPGVSGLGSPPQFGFATIGVHAARAGFMVSVDSTSPYGGVRAILRLPEDLLTAMPELGQQPKESSAVTASSAIQPEEEAGPPTSIADPSESPAPGTTHGGLPKRRRRGATISIVPAAAESTERPGRDNEPGRDSEQAAAVMRAFQRGTQSGRRSIPTGSEGNEAQ